MLNGGGYRRGLGDNGQLHHEAGPDWLIFFDANGAVVIFDDAAHDGEAQSGAAALGRKIRQKKFFF